MSPDEYRSGDPMTEVRDLARSLDGRFSREGDSEFAAGLALARDLEETGVRAVLAKHSAQLTGHGPPLFDEALAAVEAAS